MSVADRDYTIKSLHSALLIIESFLDESNAVQGITEISAELGLTKSRVFRILNTLEQHGFIEQDPISKQYCLGVQFLVYADSVQRRFEIVQAATPVIDDLAQKTGETVFVGVLRGAEAVCVARRQSVHGVRLYAEIGRRAPLHVGGVPKVLLAFMTESERDKILDLVSLPRITEQTITDPDALGAVLAEIRRKGYHVAVSDLDVGAHSIAAPIRNHTRCVVAAISVAGPSHRFTPDKIRDCIDLVCAAAAEISRRMGYNGPDLGEDLFDIF